MPVETVQDAALEGQVAQERIGKVSAAAYRIRHHALTMGEVQGHG
jgi:transketolase